ncbi:T9SS type A sorting domain-containing protein [uncultured Cytophaga sp.]|uniref:NHL domain-containing protein n=1 Tax=uncultured Cytophaga sp. TaxID=160238 RepID=UPI00260900F4|nr:T9SS type A sorting domain-containing protein [uncultured Cytophaga sp.]
MQIFNLKNLNPFFIVLFFFIFSINFVDAQIVSCYAGTRSGGWDVNGQVVCGPIALFNRPAGAAMDVAGNLYIADQLNHCIRKRSPAGIFTTLAGSGQKGSSDGLGTIASFNNPTGVAVDVDGNIYVADRDNNKIRKITPAGMVSTYAGTGETYGNKYLDGVALSATFNGPSGIALDVSGKLYLADTYNNCIRIISITGMVSTLAGSATSGASDGTGLNAKFNSPTSLVLDAMGNIYVADSENNKIRKITSAGVVTSFAGSGVAGSLDATGTAATFFKPCGITIDAAGILYVADTGNSRIRQISTNGVVSAVAGPLQIHSYSSGHLDGTGINAQFFSPNGLVSDPLGNLYVADTYNNMIRSISTGGVVITIGGNFDVAYIRDGIGAGASFSNQLSGITTDPSGNVYVIDIDKVRKITPSGIVSTFAGSNTMKNSSGNFILGEFYTPNALISDATGNIYLTDFYNSSIKKITPAGVVTTIVAFGNNVRSMTGIVLKDGNFYISSSYTHSIMRYETSTGAFTTLAGAGIAGDVNGTGTNVKFNNPAGIAIDSEGNIYLADVGNNKIKKITPDGIVTTVAGSGQAGDADGIAATASFDHPRGIAIDAIGNLYITDYGNNKIRLVTSEGIVSTIAGSGLEGDLDGLGEAAEFNNPRDIALDASGNIFVTDNGNFKVRRITNNISTAIINKNNVESIESYIYPNPVENRLFLKLSQPNGSCMVINVSGKIIAVLTIESNCIDVSKLDPGIYFLKIITKETSIIEKFIKE